MRISERESAMLIALADDAGIKQADVVRMLVRNAYRARFGEKAPRPKK